jgi:hypothetical protein
MKQFTAILLFIFFAFTGFTKDVIQFSGYVRDVNSGSPIPFCAVYIKGENRGTITSMDGFFTFVAGKGDTVLVKSLGYYTFSVIIPESIDNKSFTKEIGLERDIVELPTAVIKPLPTPAQLRQAMINLDVPNNMQELAQKTIENSILTDDISRNKNFSGKENFNQYVKQQVSYYYNRNGGQHPGISLTNPFAWAEFIKSIKKKKKAKR